MNATQWQQILTGVNSMSEEDFNELLRFALSKRAEQEGSRLDWSSGFPVEQAVGSTTYLVVQ